MRTNRQLRQKINDTGFKSFKAYFKSDKFRKIKKEFRKQNKIKECYCCGTSKNVQIEHKSHQNFGEEKTSDLMLVCRNCHAFIYEKFAKDYREVDILNIVERRRKVIKDKVKKG